MFRTAGAASSLLLATAIVAALTARTLQPDQSPRPEWDDPAVLQVGATRPHATQMVYPSAELAAAEDRDASPWFRSLNGDWKYRFAPRVSARVVDFAESGFDDGAWGTIPVPSNVELHGHGIPIYVNAGYAFAYDRQSPRPPAEFDIGGINSWTTLAWPLEKYRISGNEPHEIRYVIHPIAPAGSR